MAASGLRSSCDSIARNCSRRRTPSSISFSARRRSVTSRKVTTAPMTSPLRRIGWLQYSAGNDEPSARQITSSSTCAPSRWRIASKIGDCSGAYGRAVRPAVMDQRMHLPADQRRRRVVAEQPRARRVAERADAAQIDAVDRLRGRVQQQPDALLAVGDLLPRPHQLGDVPRDARDADDGVGAVVDRREGDRDVDDACRPCARACVSSRSTEPAVADLPHDGLDLLLAAGRIQEAGVPADRLLGRVAVELHRAAVPAS